MTEVLFISEMCYVVRATVRQVWDDMRIRGPIWNFEDVSIPRNQAAPPRKKSICVLRAASGHSSTYKTYGIRGVKFHSFGHEAILPRRKIATIVSTIDLAQTGRIDHWYIWFDITSNIILIVVLMLISQLFNMCQIKWITTFRCSNCTRITESV
jgi:hypothetical protein